MNLSSLLSLSYYMDPTPSGDFIFGYALILFFVAVFFFKTMMESVGPKNKFYKKSLRKKFWQYPILATTGIILVLARFSTVPYFSMRLWIFLVVLLTVVSCAYTKFTIYKEYDKRRKSYIRETGKDFPFFGRDS